MKNRKFILSFLVLVCMIMIFHFSHQTANKSQSLSDEVTLQVINIYDKLRNKNFDETDKRALIKDLRFVVRKGAHFSLYFLLGFFSYLTFKAYHFKYPLFLAIFFCLIYASSDEIHQLFVNARTGRVLDVLIDMCGSFIGSVISLLFCRFWMQRKNKKLASCI